MSVSDKVKQFLTNDFNKNFATLFSGSVVAQAIPILASIVLARIYTPEELGLFATYTALILIFVSVVNLRYDFAITLVKNEEESIALTLLSAYIAFVFSFVLLIVIFLFKNYILNLIGGIKLGNLLYIVPLTVFLNGMYNCLNYFNLRFKKYRVIAMSNMLRSASNATLQSVFGFLGLGVSGLIVGNTLSFFSGNIRMFNTLWQKRSLIVKVTRRDLFKVAVNHKKFPLISIWGVLINNLSLNINNFLIPQLYGTAFLGYYSYSYRNLSIPMSLISGNMGQVFYQKCVELKNDEKEIHPLFISVVKKILTIVIPVFVVCFFFIEDVFALVYGENWRVAGTFSKILLPLFLVRSVFSPLSMLTIVLDRQLLMTAMQAVILFANFILFYIAYYFDLSIIDFLSVYSYGVGIVYLILLFKLYLLSKKHTFSVDCGDRI